MKSSFIDSYSTPYQLTITDLKGEHSFSSADIIRMEAANNYTVLYFTRQRPFTVSKVLKVYEELLLPYGFLRTHRSHLVNLQFVKSVEQNCIVMQDASVAEIAKRKKCRVVKQLRSISAGFLLSKQLESYTDKTEKKLPE